MEFSTDSHLSKELILTNKIKPLQTVQNFMQHEEQKKGKKPPFMTILPTPRLTISFFTFMRNFVTFQNVANHVHLFEKL